MSTQCRYTCRNGCRAFRSAVFVLGVAMAAGCSLGPSPQPTPARVSIERDENGGTRLLVCPEARWGESTVRIPLYLDAYGCSIDAQVAGKPLLLRVDSGGAFGLSLFAGTAREVGAWISDDVALRDVGAPVFPGQLTREGAASSLVMADFSLAPVHARIHGAGRAQGRSLLGVLALHTSGAAVFDWPASTLTLVPRGGSPDLEAWVRVQLVPMPMKKTITAPYFTHKVDGLRWLRERGDSRPERTLADLPDPPPKPFQAVGIALVNTPVPCVRIQVGDVECDALIDTGYSGDLSWNGPVPPDLVHPGDPELVTMRSFSSTGVVERRKAARRLSIGGAHFDDFSIDMPRGARDSAQYGYDAVVGLGILRRQPFALDFDGHAVLFKISSASALPRPAAAPPAMPATPSP